MFHASCFMLDFFKMDSDDDYTSGTCVYFVINCQQVCWWVFLPNKETGRSIDFFCADGVGIEHFGAGAEEHVEEDY